MLPLPPSRYSKDLLCYNHWDTWKSKHSALQKNIYEPSNLIQPGTYRYELSPSPLGHWHFQNLRTGLYTNISLQSARPRTSAQQQARSPHNHLQKGWNRAHIMAHIKAAPQLVQRPAILHVRSSSPPRSFPARAPVQARSSGGEVEIHRLSLPSDPLTRGMRLTCYAPLSKIPEPLCTLSRRNFYRGQLNKFPQSDDTY